MGYGKIDGAIAANLCKVSDTAQQGISDTRSATGTGGYLGSSIKLAGNSQQMGAAQDNAPQGVGIIIFQVHIDAETGTQRGGQQSAAGGGTHQGKGAEVYLDGTCRRTLVYHNVNAVVLHGAVEVFLHHGRKTVDFVDEKHVVFFERSQYASQVAWFVEHRTAGHLEAHAQFVGYDIAQCRLSQSWRTMQQSMVKRFATVFRCLHKDFQVLHHFLLPRKVFKTQGAQRLFKVLVRLVPLFSDIEICFHENQFCHKGTIK